MSQSAENQSAIIENENNFNIDMESQAAESESSHASAHMEGIPLADCEPGTPTQDEVEQRPEVDQAPGGDLGGGDFAASNDTGEEHTAEEPAESQDDAEWRSQQLPAEGQDQEAGGERSMEVDEPGLGGGEHAEGRENVYNEPEVTDYAQDDNDDQQYPGEGNEDEPVSSQAEPECNEADNQSAGAPYSEAEGDQGIAAEDVDMEGKEFQQIETPDEDQDVFRDGAAQQGDSGAPEDQGVVMEEGQQGECGMPEGDQSQDRGRYAEGQLDDSGAPCEDQNLDDAERPQVEDQNPAMEDVQYGESGTAEEDQNLATEEAEGSQDECAVPDDDQNLPAEEPEGQPADSAATEEDQNLPVEDTGQWGDPEKEQNVPMEQGENQEEQLGENLVPGSDDNQAWGEVDPVPQVENDRPEDDQQMPDTDPEQQAESESERTEDDQILAGEETGADQQDETIDEEQLLAEDNSQDEQQADGEPLIADGESQEAEEASECQPDSSMTEETHDVKAADHDAESKDDVSTNEEENAAGTDNIPEADDARSEAGKADDPERPGDDLPASQSTEATELDQETPQGCLLNATNSESKSCEGLDKSLDDSELALDPEADRASDATIVEGRDIDDEPMLQVTDVKSVADAEERLDEKPDSAGDANPDEESMDTSVKSEALDTSIKSEAADTETTDKANDSVESELADAQTDADKTGDVEARKKPAGDDDDDVVVLDDSEDTTSQAKKKDGEKVLNSNNDMGIQIASVSGGANDVHGTNEHTDVKQKNAEPKSNQRAAAASKPDTRSSGPSGKKSRTQTCIVCKKVGKCKYNIVRNGDIKHLCDEACFKRFRANPTVFLKGAGTASNTAATEKKSGDVKPAVAAPATPGLGKTSVPGYKTCTVCLLMNLNAQGQFCIWKGLDFCGEGCLGKFQSGISSSCALCSSFIPVASRPTHCLRLGNQMRPFCSNRCYADYKLRLRLCTQCQKDAASTPDAFFSAPVGSDGSFKDFCSQACMKKFEELLNTDVEIIRVEAGKPRSVNKCSVCQKKEIVRHIIKYKGTIHNLCSDACISAFQYANKLDMKTCEFCSTLCTSRESSLHTVQFEGHQKQFCSDKCVTKFRFNNRKVSPCSWCGTQRDNFDMIERLDSASKYQLFCSLNCLSLYRVNLQAKSNQPVTCDQCTKRAPAQYHLTMSDASVRNFCSYNCVMTFQAQFSKGPPAAQSPSSAAPSTPTAQTPAQKPNTRGRPRRGRQPAPTTSPSFPIISNVISLAPQGGQQVNIKNSTGMPVVVSGATQAVKTSGTSPAPVQQQIIIQPPPPKPVKNKSILCKPFAQTKATSCRPHTQSKECQTDEVPEKPALVPVPVPVYLPAPMSLYSAPAPTPIFVPIPIPVPIFIPTTRKSANGILKQIKEIREKTPSDPLEAELLMMAAAVSADGKNSSDSESEEEILPEVNRSRKRLLPADDDDDADVMPLATPAAKEEEGGEEDMISMALRMAEEMSGPITDLESAVEAVPVSTEPPPQPPRSITPDTIAHEEEMIRNRRGGKRGGGTARRGGATGRPPKRPRLQVPQPEALPMRQEPPPPPPPPADANYHLKFTYGVNAWRHWVLFKNNQIERNMKPGCGRVKLFKTDIMQCTADELNFSLCLFVKEVRKPNGDEYSADSIYYLCLGIQQYLYENGRIDNIFTDFYYERFTECLTQILSKCQPKFNASGQMVCRIEEEHLWECKQLGAHSPYVLLNTLIYFHTKYFMLKTPEDHMKLSFAHILKYWKKGQPGKGGQPARSVSLRYYSVTTAKKDGSAPTSATKKGSKDGIPVYEVTENQENPLRCPVKLYEFYLSKCPESIKNRSDIFYPVPERSCVPDSPVWYSTMPISLEVMTKMLTRILLVREIQEAHLHAQPIYV